VVEVIWGFAFAGLSCGLRRGFHPKIKVAGLNESFGGIGGPKKMDNVGHGDKIASLSSRAIMAVKTEFFVGRKFSLSPPTRWG
jgi:hypothetical protein